MTKRWNILNADAEKASSLHEALKINKTLARFSFNEALILTKKQKIFLDHNYHNCIVLG